MSDVCCLCVAWFVDRKLPIESISPRPALKPCCCKATAQKARSRTHLVAERSVLVYRVSQEQTQTGYRRKTKIEKRDDDDVIIRSQQRRTLRGQASHARRSCLSRPRALSCECGSPPPAPLTSPRGPSSCASTCLPTHRGTANGRNHGGRRAACEWLFRSEKYETRSSAGGQSIEPSKSLTRSPTLAMSLLTYPSSRISDGAYHATTASMSKRRNHVPRPLDLSYRHARPARRHRPPAGSQDESM